MNLIDNQEYRVVKRSNGTKLYTTTFESTYTKCLSKWSPIGSMHMSPLVGNASVDVDEAIFTNNKSVDLRIRKIHAVKKDDAFPDWYSVEQYQPRGKSIIIKKAILASLPKRFENDTKITALTDMEFFKHSIYYISEIHDSTTFDIISRTRYMYYKIACAIANMSYNFLTLDSNRLARVPDATLKRTFTSDILLKETISEYSCEYKENHNNEYVTVTESFYVPEKHAYTPDKVYKKRHRKAKRFPGSITIKIEKYVNSPVIKESVVQIRMINRCTIKSSIDSKDVNYDNRSHPAKVLSMYDMHKEIHNESYKEVSPIKTINPESVSEEAKATTNNIKPDCAKCNKCANCEKNLNKVVTNADKSISDNKERIPYKKPEVLDIDMVEKIIEKHNEEFNKAFKNLEPEDKHSPFNTIAKKDFLLYLDTGNKRVYVVPKSRTKRIRFYW